MKTEIRTLIAICTLAIIGISNINAKADLITTTSNTEVATEQEASLTIESWMTNDDYWTSKATMDTLEKEDALHVEAWMTNESLWK